MSFPWDLNGNTETECCSDLFVNIFESDATTKAAGKLRNSNGIMVVWLRDSFSGLGSE